MSSSSTSLVGEMMLEDFAAMLDDLGVDVLVAGEPARGVWDNSYVDVIPNEQLVESASAVLTVLDEVVDARDVGHGTEVRIGSKTFHVVSVQPDGVGTTQLHLGRGA